ncbi:proton-conducting transporter membrane subunit [Candidatus Anaplasma sp. TIGMIC]|uniref:proton-conducting transporter transmembrane domain-containing protein n=1 Tax=Candidatus Anaplasma sp. TIGMIC TaxID=3020713 RepID=UPI00233100DF|nr:proton-conducting transporter membrane subunit [Candidatus Anaplasma sp. TIGMIC]MDB1135016.1 proton-conducting transporter membrane subunit [Candidatus Anaplasma sp. TIGMIC]
MGFGLYAVAETAMSIVPKSFELGKYGAFLSKAGDALPLLVSFVLALLCIFLRVRGSSKEVLCALMYSASSSAVLISSDLITIVIGFEFMALAAMFLIASGGCEGRKIAFLHYACMHFFSGALLLVGACQYAYSGYLEGLPMVFFMIGLLINAAAFPMSSWLISAYPRASRFGMPVLSLFTTKVAMYFLLKMFAGEPIVLVAGILTAAYAVVSSFVETNVRRLVSYGIIGQVGIVLMSIGCNGIPADVIMAQMVFSVLYQLLFILIADSVVMRSAQTDLDKMVGSIRIGSIEFVGCLVAVLNIGACPGTASFVAKALMLHMDLESTGYFVLKYVQPVLVLLLFASVALKFFWFCVLRAHTSSKLKTSEGFLAGTSTVILSLSLIILGLIYGQGILFSEPKFVYTLHDVGAKLALISAVILCFFLFRSKFLGCSSATSVESWVQGVFLSVRERLDRGLWRIKPSSQVVAGRNGVPGVFICGCDTVSLSTSPSGIITSTLLLVMLSICVVLVWFYV